MVDPILGKKHMLGSAKPDTIGTELERILSIDREIGIGTDAQPAEPVGPFEDDVDASTQIRFDHRGFAKNDPPGRTVDRDDVPCFHDCLRRRQTAGGHSQLRSRRSR